MHQGLHTLDRLPLGDAGVIHRVGGEPRVARRLMEMGLLPGTRIEAVGRAPMGDPLEIRLRGYLFSLRHADAAHVQLLPDGRADLGAAADPAPARRLPAHEAPAPADPAREGAARVPRVLVAGNANSGKTTVFNALTGARAHVGNYPGVTVTRASRRITLPGGAPAEIVDLPGTYSLAAHSPDEQVAVDGVLGRHEGLPDAVVVVVDAGVIERALYLVLQIAETGVPVVVALNMMDEAEAAGAEFDAERLGRWLGAAVVPTVASRGVGLDALRRAVADAVALAPRTDSTWTGLPPEAERDVSAVTRALDGGRLRPHPRRAPFVGTVVAAVARRRRRRRDRPARPRPRDGAHGAPGRGGRAAERRPGDHRRALSLDRGGGRRRPDRPASGHPHVDPAHRRRADPPGLRHGGLRGGDGGGVRSAVHVVGAADRRHRNGHRVAADGGAGGTARRQPGRPAGRRGRRRRGERRSCSCRRSRCCRSSSPCSRTSAISPGWRSSSTG